MNDQASCTAHETETNIYVCPMHPEVRQNGPGDCPKCGMHLVPEEEVAAPDHQAHDHHASAAPADGRYDTVPDGYDGAVYTCPMHPTVRQTEPGSCPICGMGLELESAAMAEDGPNPELVDFTRRFWGGTVLTIPLLILTMGPYLGFPGVREIFGDRQGRFLLRPVLSAWRRAVADHMGDKHDVRSHDERDAGAAPPHGASLKIAARRQSSARFTAQPTLEL